MKLQREHKETLLHYINTYPSAWKVKIKQDWDSFAFCTPSLRALRNTYGSSWLMKLTANKVRESEVIGDILVDADYSQIEPRIIAAIYDLGVKDEK